MSHEDARRLLRVFERGRGSTLVELASHAALPVVLNPDLVHLLRVNYFLDPPVTLPYAAEAELMLSPLCTEVDQGLYVIDPDLRDVLLEHLVRHHGAGRLRDVARLLLEYGQRASPWADRPGLSEAQQLTALNFLDPPRARDWLARAEERSGAGPAADKRWFVAMRKDLTDRTTAASGRTFDDVEFLRGSLLNSLDAAERAAFVLAARQRTFVRGTTLMQEGEPANSVIVILSGWTQITVRENGNERVIAERGPGQLVGERGALRVNVRSATVVALDTVRALVMTTEDFAAFINAHPRVLDIVEGQIYDKLTEDQRGGWRDGSAGFPPEPGPGPVEGSRRRLLAGENCTILLTDVVGFGALNRNDDNRRIIRLASHDMMRSSLGRVWTECISEDRGDGLLLVMPPHIPTARVMTLLHRELPDRLRRHNRTYSEPARIRLRVAVNVGPVMSDEVGISGEAIIRAARLIDAPVFKEAMAETGATLGIIASEFVYETAIRHTELTNFNEYSLVQVNVKEATLPGWMRLVEMEPPAPRSNTAATASDRPAHTSGDP